tara:strand:- start:11535 stop:14705 length:3171 start_codon:yes stop_codon:yes gene_type:complete
MKGQTKGVVKDRTGVTLPGVSVIEKGTNNGASTDFDGKFNIVLKKQEAILVFSYLGFKTKEIPVKKNGNVEVVLEEDVAKLDEVVVVGYGTQIKREVTSSMSTIKDLNEGGNTSSIGELLQGKSTGLQISTTDASPGAAMRVTVRGTNSITSGTEPLWIIDGIAVNSEQSANGLTVDGTSEMSNPLADINPDEIESIQVLKDAASTSIYGSRGANGVILVTTKQGKIGKPRVNVSFESGLSEAVNYKKYVNTSQYFELIDEAGVDFNPSIFDETKFSLTRAQAEQINNNWLEDYLLRTGEYRTINTSISGGSESTKYFISLFNKNTTGVLVGDERDDYAFAANFNVKLSNKLEFGINSRISYSDSQKAQKGGGPGSSKTGVANWGGRGGMRSASSVAMPFYPVYADADETVFFDPQGGRSLYPSSLSKYQSNTTKGYGLRLIGTINYKIAKALTLNAKAGISFSLTDNFYYIDGTIRAKERVENIKNSSRAYQSTSTSMNNTFNATLNYNKRFNDFKLNVLLGTESFTKTRKYEMADFEDLTSQQQSIAAINSSEISSGGFLRANYYEKSDLFASFFGRVNTTFKNKYLFGLTVRYDGSSVFAPKNRWGGFGSVSGGWIISDEEFMKEQDLFNLLKLRASYGSAGNASIDSFKWLNTFNGNFSDYGVSKTLIPDNIGTDNLTWEKSYTTDVAIDYGILNNRISGSIGYFQTNTKDMLLDVPIVLSSGIYTNQPAPTALINIGEMSNKGLEFEVSSTNIRTKNFSWKTSFNISTIKNEVGELASQIKTPLQIAYAPSFIGTSSAINSIWTGERLGRFYVAEYAGLDSEGYQTIYEIDQEKFIASGSKITEKTGNVIRATQQNTLKNKVYQNNKTGLPTYFGGLSNTFTYKGFSLSSLFNFSGGNYIYNQTGLRNGAVNTGANVIDADLYGNTWVKGVRENTKYPIQVEGNRDPDGNILSYEHTGNLHKGDFVRLQNIRLAYKFPKKVLDKLSVDRFEIYTNVSNVFVWSKFKAFDPEFVNFGDIHAINSDRNLGQGYINRDPLPKARTISIGSRIRF